MKKFYITTPIYYVNDEPHIGHAYTTVIADVIAKYYQLSGIPTFFLTGTDEHGTKIVDVATKHNLEPKQYCDMIVEKFKHEWQRLKIEYSNFIRTTDLYHEQTVQKVLQKMYENDDIYKSYYEGLYCIQCERFVSEEELTNGLCPDHGTKPVIHKEENYFFKLSKYKEKIYQKIESEELKIIPEIRQNEILGKLQLKVEDISISRKNLKWGIPLPFDTEQTTYVWIDALINYLSGIDYFHVKSTTMDKFDFSTDNFWPCDLHIIGKDILWFHAVIWPAMLLSVNLPLPKKILAHGFFTVEGKKMSKTLGNIVRPKELVDIFGVDATRLLVLSMFPVGSDGDFSLAMLKEQYNKSLADNYGNLVSRTFGMISKYFSDRFEIQQLSSGVNEIISSYIKNYRRCFDELAIHKVADTALEVASFANRYVQEQEPWVLFKNNQIQKLQQVLSDLLYCIKVTTLLLYPIMPEKTSNLLRYFVSDKTVQQEFYELLNKGVVNIKSIDNKLPTEILFQKVK